MIALGWLVECSAPGELDLPCRWTTDRLEQRTGAVRRVDQCMRALVQELNDAGIQTFDSCCGHGERWDHVTIAAADADRARALGYRLSTDNGVSHPEYPFTGLLGEHVTIVLPPILRESA